MVYLPRQCLAPHVCQEGGVSDRGKARMVDS